MTAAGPEDELLLFAHPVLEMRAHSLGRQLDFDSFLRDWRPRLIEAQDATILSLWQGPDQDRVALLCGRAPDWPLLAITDFSPSRADPTPKPRHGSFLLPGEPLTHWGDCLSKYGIFLGWWPVLNGTALRLTRLGQPVTLTAEQDDFLLLDLHDPAPVDHFDGIARIGGGWAAPIAPWIPYDQAQAWQAYLRHHRHLLELGYMADPLDHDRWASDIFFYAGTGWADLAVRMMSAADPIADEDALQQFGALIYGNDAAFFRRLGAEIDAGNLRPDVVGLVISMERPDYLDPEDLVVFRRLQGRCGPSH